MKKQKDARHTLTMPFERGNIAINRGENWLFFNATPLEPLEPSGSTENASDWQSVVTAIQPFRPQFNALQLAGYRAHAASDGIVDASATSFDGALVLAGKSQSRNRLAVADAVRLVKAGAPIVVCGDKASGVGGLRKWATGLAEQAGSTVEALSKNHAVVFWFPAAPVCGLPQWPSSPQSGGEGEGGLLNAALWHTAPGTFSADGPDAGSALLAAHFSTRMRGKVADLGSGWGYLSAKALVAAPDITSVDLFEADHHALVAARENVPDARAQFHWCDVANEAPKGPFDWVIMNPPFHDGGHKGRAAEPRIGRTFIEAAAKCLPSGGRLLMVANRQLPYEDLLKSRFRKVVPVEDRGGFKVIEAMR
ncbi:MAG: class I SAM-dependent methyltransferase [Pseudomonadota bacterium]